MRMPARDDVFHDHTMDREQAKRAARRIAGALKCRADVHPASPP